MCNHDCLNCTRNDCDCDEMSFAEYKRCYEVEKELKREQELMNPDIDRRREWELRNMQRAKRNKHRHYATNKEKYNARSKKYYEEHKDELLENQKDYRSRNREMINAREREAKRKRWAENPEKYRQKQREYRARKKAERAVG